MSALRVIAGLVVIAIALNFVVRTLQVIWPWLLGIAACAAAVWVGASALVAWRNRNRW